MRKPFFDKPFGEVVIVCDPAAVDALLDLRGQHVLQVGAEGVTKRLGIGASRKSIV